MTRERVFVAWVVLLLGASTTSVAQELLAPPLGRLMAGCVGPALTLTGVLVRAEERSETDGGTPGHRWSLVGSRVDPAGGPRGLRDARHLRLARAGRLQRGGPEALGVRHLTLELHARCDRPAPASA